MKKALLLITILAMALSVLLVGCNDGKDEKPADDIDTVAPVEDIDADEDETDVDETDVDETDADETDADETDEDETDEDETDEE